MQPFLAFWQSAGIVHAVPQAGGGTHLLVDGLQTLHPTILLQIFGFPAHGAPQTAGVGVGVAVAPGGGVDVGPAGVEVGGDEHAPQSAGQLPHVSPPVQFPFPQKLGGVVGGTGVNVAVGGTTVLVGQ